ncbi:MAG: prepilin-type N-terminal cleavage/methylation domain-containing protein [Planctomycetota bacterium]|jgi:prepilin-type N-terminal cleavage/methylation domain-containing protein|nr:prepilin-type N-terminal cleavage/methylation domain-containing protein [Planctomycetota bacterium]
MRIHRIKRANGFTLIEIMIATTIAMILLFGALYSTSETLNVVREGDAVVHTNVHGRRALDRVLKDFRYSAALAITGDNETGWSIAVTTTGTLDPGALTYNWTPNSKTLTVTGPSGTEIVLQDLRSFSVNTVTETIDEENVITRVSVEWELGITAGNEAGVEGIHEERTLSLAGATWVRKNDI